MTKVPKSVFIVNGGTLRIASVEEGKDQFNNPTWTYKNMGTPKLCTFMDKANFAMSFHGKIVDQAVPGQQPQQIGFPVISQEIGRWSATGSPADICYAYTHIYIDKYIEPTPKNLQCFFWRSKNPKYNHVVPPPDKRATIKQFGMPDVWLNRDENNGIRFEKNQNKDGPQFRVIGPEASPPEEFPPPSAIRDFRPGPGQPVRPKAPV